MRFLLDAQLPRRLVTRLNGLGHDSIHTLDLPEGNRTKDSTICEIADLESRVVVTKDRDFVDHLVLRGTPNRLLLVATGNIGNDELFEIFVSRVNEIESYARQHRFIELGRAGLIVRD